ncbi:DNA repair protein RecN [Dysgonomonas sp. 216]|uniref:DNA repair protein RecN n=1 Tax=Dysgonomonas sp. 216 TaxID=2302934 RepID=UPI0013D8C7AE|nr:DNA repair protein RecN [Dysgonomonas sp. 216]NDW18606.1 DNA repair protein RecN [Dysgonomonas sp. 216]
MLKSLYIKNYALIDNLEVDFESGFSVITGETGAGKSIILGALSLILGLRADTKIIKTGETKCVIEGVFDVSAYDLRGFCATHDIEYDGQSYIFRREILSTGKSRAFINDTPVSLTDLKLLGEQLIDIHSQHKNLLLGDSRFQLQVVDILAANSDLLKKYHSAYTVYKQVSKELVDLNEKARLGKEEEDYLRFQFKAFEDANLVDGEQDELEKELEMLDHAEDIKTTLFKVYNILSDDENGIVPNLKRAISTAQSLERIYPTAEDIIDRLNSAYVDLKDLSPEVERCGGDIEFSPERYEIVQNRLDMIYALQQKHRVSSVSELLNIYEELKKKLENIDSFDEQIKQLQLEVEARYEAILQLAAELSFKRKEASSKIEKQLIERITPLGMPNVQFVCEITPKSEPDVTGADNLVFMFSANKNVPLQPIASVASGGEISRVMLCLKSMIAGATALPTIIFDEIDTGVSGDVADKMGLIMKEFGQKMQVIAITHLPQIAAKGRTHYFVYKEDNTDTTTTNLRKLSDDERIRELAQMLSGAQITEAAIINAKEMLGL